MPVEIERKFLVADDAWRGGVMASRRLVQFYLARDGAASVRVRIEEGVGAWLTIKAAKAGLRRLEHEYPIPATDARELQALAEGAVIEKVRHLVPWGAHVVEVDEMLGENAGLVVAEIEFQTEDEQPSLPDWLGTEVTHDKRYYNQQLAMNPYSLWSRLEENRAHDVMSERGAVTLRPARPDDLPTVTRWDGEPHVIAASGVDAGEWDWPAMLAEPQPAWREMLIGEEAGRPVGIVQIIDPEAEETHYWGDVGPGHRAIDIWIGPKTDLGRGLGTEMMRLAIDRCFADPGVTTVLIDPLASNTRAHRFYRRLGFRDIGPRRFGDDDCVVMALSRSDWQRRHD